MPAYIEIERITLGATASELVDKINEIIAALTAYQPITDYSDLTGKPTINNVEIDGDMSFGDLNADLSEDTTIISLAARVTANEDAITEHGTAIGQLEDSIPDDEDIVAACEGAYIKKDLSNVDETVLAGKNGYVPVVGGDGVVGKMKLSDYTSMITTMQEAARSAADTAMKEKRQYIPVTYTAGIATVEAASSFRIGTTLLYVNGVLQAEGTDYTCTDNDTIELLTYVPVAGDIIQLMAIPAA